tara:strand:- start:2637 stop:3200 length:564 start_codon:yes stop_codon:yes gene_type:complete
MVCAVVFIWTSLERPEVPTFTPTVAATAEVGTEQDARTVTVDASDSEVWRFFDFSRGSVVEAPGEEEWDIAFRRFQIIANGGRGMEGQAGATSLEDMTFESVSSVPETGYVMAERNDSVNAVLEDWYNYSFTSHLLEPKPIVYAIRTADGRYAKLEILGYYCVGVLPGCTTFRYVYQGGGGVDVISN